MRWAMAPITLEPDRTAVVIVDMQVDFCAPEGALYAAGSQAVLDPLVTFAARAAAAGCALVATRDVHPRAQFADAHAYDEFDRWGEHVVEGTAGAALVDAVAALPPDVVVAKHTYDAFHETQLAGWLTAHGIDTLCVCGTLANVCVLHTAAQAALRDLRVIMCADAIGAIEPAHHTMALEHAAWLFAEVTETDGVAFAG